MKQKYTKAEIWSKNSNIYLSQLSKITLLICIHSYHFAQILKDYFGLKCILSYYVPVQTIVSPYDANCVTPLISWFPFWDNCFVWLKVIPGEAGFRTDCFKIWVYNTKDIILQTSIVASCPSVYLNKFPRYSFICNLIGNMQKSLIIKKVQTKKFLNFPKCKCGLQFI